VPNECAITTDDNPYDPFRQFDHWFLYDCEKGYYTCSYLGRIARLADAMSEDEKNAELERAIDEIIAYDFLGIYKKVRRNDYKTAKMA
jgi:hypothetical protein